MVATLASPPHVRPRIDPRIFLLVFPLVAAVIIGLLIMHVLAMHPSKQEFGHDGSGTAVTTSEAKASIQGVAVPGVHAGDTCVSSSLQAVVALAPAESPYLTPGAPSFPAIPPDPTGNEPDLFTLCVQLC